MAIESKGTVLWYWQGTPTEQDDLKKVICPTSFEIDPGEWGSVESPPCLETGKTTTLTGARGQATASAPVNFTPDDHKTLYGHYDNNDTINFILGYSDGTADPLFNDGDFDPPTGRSSKKFKAFISNMPETFDPANVVVSTLSLTLSSPPTATWKQ